MTVLQFEAGSLVQKVRCIHRRWVKRIAVRCAPCIMV